MNKLLIFILPAFLLFAPFLTADCQQAQTRTASQSPAASADRLMVGQFAKLSHEYASQSPAASADRLMVGQFAKLSHEYASQSPGVTADKPVYETRADHDPDGIGKFYMGREIAHVMGYQGAGWLERPERVEEERPDQVVEQMKLKPANVVADVGAGTGYFSFRISRIVTHGKVFAVDIQPEMLKIIDVRKKHFNAENVIAVRSEETDAKLPENSVDVALMVDVYHEFAFPREMMLSVVKALKPGGRVVQIEYRGEDPNVPIKRLHKMTVAQARKEMAAVGLVWKETKDFLPQQHFIVYEKPVRQ